MNKAVRATTLIMACLSPSGLEAANGRPGTKGQNYDRVVFESQSDGAVELSASVMTINRYRDSSSSISVTDNGRPIFGPEMETTERWRRVIPVSGKGRHEVFMICDGVQSSPVYCALNVDDARARVLE